MDEYALISKVQVVVRVGVSLLKELYK